VFSVTLGRTISNNSKTNASLSQGVAWSHLIHFEHASNWLNVDA
jgi:hypothetical protein